MVSSVGDARNVGVRRTVAIAREGRMKGRDKGQVAIDECAMFGLGVEEKIKLVGKEGPFDGFLCCLI